MYDVLSKNPGMAYQASELYVAVTGRAATDLALMDEEARQGVLDAWNDAIASLEKAGRVAMVKHDDGILYAYCAIEE